jgi:hypothetical protein
VINVLKCLGVEATRTFSRGCSAVLTEDAWRGGIIICRLLLHSITVLTLKARKLLAGFCVAGTLEELYLCAACQVSWRYLDTSF